MKRLKNGSTIGIYSPSTPITKLVPSRFERGKKYMIEKGFNIVEGKLTGKSDFYRSGSILERAEELNQLLRDPNIDCIMSTIGGMNSNSLLPYLDYDAFKRHPKIVIGYSDATAILLALYAKTGITTFYGPALVASFGEFPPYVDETYNYFMDIVGKEHDIYEFETPSYWTDEFIDWGSQNRGKTRNENKWISVFGGQAKGRLIGGNIDTISGIWGSQYMPEIMDGDILLIEGCLKDAATVERYFSLLKVNDVFDKIGGILLGKHELFNDNGTCRMPHDILVEVLNGKEIPLISEFDCCHTHPMLTMPIGSIVTVDSTNLQVTVEGGYMRDYK